MRFVGMGGWLWRRLQALVLIPAVAAGSISGLAPAGAWADSLSSRVEISQITSIDGEGLGLGLIGAEGSVGPSLVTIQETFEVVAPIDVTLRVNDRGGGPRVYLVYDPYLYNLSFQKWAGFRHQLGYKDAEGNFYPSDELDGLSFATDEAWADSFFSSNFSVVTFGPGLDTIDWSGGLIHFPDRVVFLFAILVPASNPAMPSFALRDGGYEFTLRELPIVSWEDVPRPSIVPEPPSRNLFGVGLFFLALAARLWWHRQVLRAGPAAPGGP